LIAFKPLLSTLLKLSSYPLLVNALRAYISSDILFVPYPLTSLWVYSRLWLFWISRILCTSLFHIAQSLRFSRLINHLFWITSIG